MSFDLLRRHRRKVEIPLAIFVIVLFALAFGGAGGLDHFLAERGRARGVSGSELDARLLSFGRDLSAAALMADPGRSGQDRDPESVRRWYRLNAAYRYYLPGLVAGELGVRVGDAELREAVEQNLQGPAWNLSPPIDQDKYQKAMANRGLAAARYEELLRGLLAAARTADILGNLGAASEAERYGYYAYANQKVRVQYIQRRMADFVPVVEEASAKEAAAKEAAGAPAAKPGEKPGPAPERKGVAEEDIRKRYDKDVQELRGRGDAPKEAWDPEDVQEHPEYFTEERAAVEYLVALREDFAKGQAVPEADVEKYYQDNKDHEFPEEPPKDQKPDEKKAPKPRALDGKLRGEIGKKLRDREGLKAAEAALKAAIEEYNRADKDKRPTLAQLAAKHKLAAPLAAGPAPRRELESAKHLEEARPGAALAFRERDPGQLTGNLSTPMRLKDQEGFLALRVVSFEPIKLLGYEQAKAAVRERLVLDKALGLAKEAAAADLKALRESQLPAARVRESELLGPGGETCRQAADLAVGEAGEPYAYFELLGAEAAAEKDKDKDKEKDKDKDKARARKKAKPAITDSYPKGWRVIILAGRRRPTLEEYRADKEWLTNFWHPWNPWAAMYGQQQPTPDDRWRQFYFRGWEITEAKRLGF